MELVVTRAFSAYSVGQLITDPYTIATVLNGQYSNNVVVVGAEFTLAVTSAFIGSALGLSGYALGATPTGLDYSVDDGVTWTPVINFVLQNGQFTGNGPTYNSILSGIIQVRDHANPASISSPVTFSVLPPLPRTILTVTQPNGDGTALITYTDGTVTSVTLPVGPAGGVNSIASLTGNITAPALAAAIIAGLPTSPAGLSVGQSWNNGGILTAVEAE